MARPTQCSGGGQANGKPVDSLERTPTTGQKQLRGKNGKSYHDRQYKRPWMCTVKNIEKQGGKGNYNGKEKKQGNQE